MEVRCSGETMICSSQSTRLHQRKLVAGTEEAEPSGGDDIRGSLSVRETLKLGFRSPGQAIESTHRRRGIFSLRSRRIQRDSSSSSSSSSMQPNKFGGVRIKARVRGPLALRGGRGSVEDFQDLALPLGMSFAAIVAQVLDRKTGMGEAIPTRHICMICNSAIKESLNYIYGSRFDSFMSKFEKSFGSTLTALQSINAKSVNVQGNSSYNVLPRSEALDVVEHSAKHHPEFIRSDFQLFDHLRDNFCTNEIILHEGMAQQLRRNSDRNVTPNFHHSTLSVFEKSIMEQSRSNDLKELEIGMTMKRLQMKQAQLNMENVKISLGISKANFKEEKLRNQMQESKHAEFLKRCIDLLVSGLVIMSCLLLYGAYVFSFQRIMDASIMCTAITKEKKSWWFTKKMASFSSGWSTLRCHAVVLTRMVFGLLMILSVAYLLVQRSSLSGSTMPVTFILILLGALCGFAGKLCVDTLGGDGYCWLFYWEALCLLHFLANAFPYMVYRVIYGPVSVSRGLDAVMFPYWLRRVIFYSLVLLILPIASGTLPFGTFLNWKEHFLQKVSFIGWGAFEDHEHA